MTATGRRWALTWSGLARRHAPLSSYAVALLTVADLMDGTGRQMRYRSVREMAALCPISERTFWRALGWARAAGWLEVVNQVDADGYTDRNRYRLVVPPGTSMASPSSGRPCHYPPRERSFARSQALPPVAQQKRVSPRTPLLDALPRDVAGARAFLGAAAYARVPPNPVEKPPARPPDWLARLNERWLR